MPRDEIRRLGFAKPLHRAREIKTDITANLKLTHSLSADCWRHAMSRRHLLLGVVSSRDDLEDGGRLLRAIELTQYGLQRPFPPTELDARFTATETVGLSQFANQFSVGGAQCSPEFLDVVTRQP